MKCKPSMTHDELYQWVYHHLAGGLTCKEVTEAVTDYLEGAMGPVDWARFQMHLGFCVGCRIYLRQMKSTVQATKCLPAAPVPVEVREELLQRFRSWKSA